MTYYTINPYLKEVTQTFEKINPHLYHKRKIYIYISNFWKKLIHTYIINVIYIYIYI